MREFGLPLGALVLNRVLPRYLLDPSAGHSVLKLGDENLPVRLRDELDGAFAAESVVRGVLASVGENFMNFRMVAAREADELRQIAQWAPGVLVTIPYFEADIYDIEGLARVAGAMFA